MYSTKIPILAHGGASSRDDPERRSEEWRPAAAARDRGLGRSGTPPARHDDLAARSIAARIRRQCRRWKRGPRPKIATVERREASVPRHGTRRASLGRIVASRKRDNRDSAPVGAPPTPLLGVDAITRTKPGRSNAPWERTTLRCLTS